MLLSFCRRPATCPRAVAGHVCRFLPLATRLRQPNRGFGGVLAEAARKTIPTSTPACGPGAERCWHDTVPACPGSFSESGHGRIEGACACERCDALCRVPRVLSGVPGPRDTAGGCPFVRFD